MKPTLMRERKTVGGKQGENNLILKLFHDIIYDIIKYQSWLSLLLRFIIYKLQ